MKQKKNLLFLVGILSVLLVFGFVLVGCGGDEDPPAENEDVYARWAWVENNTNSVITKVVFSTEADGGGQHILTDNDSVPAHSKKAYKVGDDSCYVSITVEEGSPIHSDNRVSPAQKYIPPGYEGFVVFVVALNGSIGSFTLDANMRENDSNYYRP